LKRIFWKRILFITLALITLLAVVGCKESAKYAVMAERIYYDYTTDAAAADELYKNTKIQVTGIIRSLGTDSAGSPYVILEPGDLSETYGVQCTFTSKYASLVASLSVGQQITISGTCLGYSNHVVILVK
jgi:hypothetical protein